jgi:hypothetical protein
LKLIQTALTRSFCREQLQQKRHSYQHSKTAFGASTPVAPDAALCGVARLAVIAFAAGNLGWELAGTGKVISSEKPGFGDKVRKRPGRRRN